MSADRPTRPEEAARRQSELAETLACHFESTVLYDTVRDALLTDDQVSTLLDGVAIGHRAQDLRKEAFGDNAEHLSSIAEGAGKLSYVASRRAREVVAESCAAVIEDGDDWVREGKWPANAVAESKNEAREWISYHTNAADRAEVLDVISADE